MRHMAIAGAQERKELFEATARKVGIRPDATEKDFWICYMLDHLFHDSVWRNVLVFKGGTSLSKSYHLIKRFSEDIDLILDWRSVVGVAMDPWDDRSRSRQNQFNQMMNHEAAVLYRDQLVPALNQELAVKLSRENMCSIDANDEMVINVHYPHLYDPDYLRPTVRLEIGPLAEWMPSHITEVAPFVAEQYPALFKRPTTRVLTIDAERSFWEKVAILHKIANYPEGKTLAPRYARHLYDVYCMGHSPLKGQAFARRELLRRDILFEQKFYYSKGAHYENATLNTIQLIPADHIMKALRADYHAMENMIYGEVPEFDEIIRYLRRLENEIHALVD